MTSFFKSTQALSTLVLASFSLSFTLQASDTAHHPTSHAAAKGVSPDTALRYLKNGNTRYLKNNLRSDGQGQARRNETASAQQPHTIVLSCSDSRVPPELIFDQKLGEIFVVRTAGESLDSMAIASIEYAVEHLGPQLVVVMGHSSCGAVKAAFETLKSKSSAGSPHLDKLVADIQPRIASKIEKGSSPKFVEESSMNAVGVAKDLAERSQILKTALAAGKLKIVPALYSLDDGRVSFLGEAASSKAHAR
jgi:carbonic anhydrase